MKIYTALILAVVTFWELVVVGATSPCDLSVNATTKLNKGKYFRDHWFVTHFWGKEVPEKSSAIINKYCANTMGLIKGNAVKEVLHHYNTQRGTSLFDISTVTVNGGKYTANYKRVDESGKEIGMSGTYTVTVVDTDNDNYAITHLCLTIGEDAFEMYYILNRWLQKTHQDVASGLTSAGLRLPDFISVQELNCKTKIPILIELLKK